MRYVELRRHTDNDGDKLSEQGVADAEAICRTGLNPPYAAFISTGAERATEMLRILRRAAGQNEIPITTETGMRSSVEDRWRAAAKVAGKGASSEEMRAVDPDLVEHETRLLDSALQRVVQGLPEGGRALVVGHSPTNEAAVSGLVGETIAAIGKGEGVLIVEDRGRYEVRRLLATIEVLQEPSQHGARHRALTSADCQRHEPHQLARGPELFTRLFVYWHDPTRSVHADSKRRSAEFVSACWNGAANGEKRTGGSLMIASIREKHGAAQVR